MLSWDYRELIGADFDDEVHSAGGIWRDLFGDEIPHFGGNLDDYLTNYIAV